MSILFLWIQIVVCAALIFYFGRKLVLCGEGIAKRKNISEGLVGFGFLAFATSLPEIVTGLGSVQSFFPLFKVDIPDFAVGDALGSMLFNLGVIALLKILLLSKKDTNLPLLINLEKSNIFIIFATNLLLVICGLSIFLRKQFLYKASLFNIGYESFLLIIIFIFLLKKIWIFQKSVPQTTEMIEEDSFRGINLWVKFTIYAFMILLGGVWLAKVGKELVLLSGLNTTCFGATVLAIITSFPEISVSISALSWGIKKGRTKAGLNMSVGNVLGSNFFDVMIIPFCDIFYRRGAILSDVSQANIKIILLVIVFGSFVASAIYIKHYKRKGKEYG